MKFFIMWEILSILLSAYGLKTYCWTDEEIKGITTSVLGVFLVVIGFIIF